MLYLCSHKSCGVTEVATGGRNSRVCGDVVGGAHGRIVREWGVGITGEAGTVVGLAVALFKNVVEAASNERICPSGGSIGQIWGSPGVICRSFSWKRSARNGGVLEKVLHSSARPHVDLVPGRNRTGTCLMRADT